MVRGMWLMLQQSEPDDYVLGSGKTHSVKEFLEVAFGMVDLRSDLDYRHYIKIDPKFYRPADVNLLCAAPSKAKRVLGWKPTIGFEKLVEDMVKSDCGAI